MHFNLIYVCHMYKRKDKYDQCDPPRRKYFASEDSVNSSLALVQHLLGVGRTLTINALNIPSPAFQHW